MARAMSVAPVRPEMQQSTISWDSKSDDEADDELRDMPVQDLQIKAEAFKEAVKRSSKEFGAKESSSKSHNSRTLLVTNVLDEGGAKDKHHHHHHKKKGAFAGVFVPTCENMWGVLIFLRFHFIVGNAGIGQALAIVILSFSCAFCTTSSMSATVSSGGLVSKGGPYYMISRALGPCVGASVGVMYWLAITMLAVLETLGAVEGILMASPEADFPFCKQVYGSVLMVALVFFVYIGISFVTKMGIFFVFVVFFTMFSYYYGLCSNGLSLETAKENWASHYGNGTSFGYCLSVFFPCFTGILSGANRADILRDPPKNLKQGTFGAIIFSLFMYSSFMILWGMSRNYQYLLGPGGSAGSSHRRLAGGTQGAHVVTEIVWNPFPNSAHIGIIISSLSQALQCLIVAPRILQSIAKDHILSVLDRLAPLSKQGEAVRALGATYVVAALLVLMGQLDLVAPLLSMCFLVAYAFMNFSCFALTWLKSPAWRPKGIQRKRWRLWYSTTSFLGFLICLTIMFTINVLWALAALVMSLLLYFYINWKLEARGWGSAMDGIRFQLALNSLIKLEGTQQHHVNWRPQVLILYRIHLAEELKGIKHHEILRFYSQLRKGNSFCVVAVVLEADRRDEHAIHKARIEKGIIQTIMKEENIQGFATVVVAPSWVEGSSYIIQLTGIGGLAPNTVLLDWPEDWQKHTKKAHDFVNILSTALAAEKAVLATKGLVDMATEPVYGTIDIWWMIHDGGFLILLSWLLVQHRIWRKCHLRVFTITEAVSEEKAKRAAEHLSKTLRQRRLFDVDVEVIVADGEMIEPYFFDYTVRVEDRHNFLKGLQKEEKKEMPQIDPIPLDINDLFNMGDSANLNNDGGDSPESHTQPGEGEGRGLVTFSDIRDCTTGTNDSRNSKSSGGQNPPNMNSGDGDTKHQCNVHWKYVSQEEGQANLTQKSLEEGLRGATSSDNNFTTAHNQNEQGEHRSSTNAAGLLTPIVNAQGQDEQPKGRRSLRRINTMQHGGNVESFTKLNQIIFARSKRAQLVVMNLPDMWGTEPEEVKKFMAYCDTLTDGLERVLFVHSSGHEIFDLSY